MAEERRRSNKWKASSKRMCRFVRRKSEERAHPIRALHDQLLFLRQLHRWVPTFHARTSCRRRDHAARALSILYGLVRDHLDAFLDHARESYARGLPHYVEQAFRAYLRCGIFAHGFLRLHCDDCRPDLLVAFSCKGRGICPSCSARRMCNTAAHVPVRQDVLTMRAASGSFVPALAPASRSIGCACSRMAALPTASSTLGAAARTV